MKYITDTCSSPRKLSIQSIAPFQHRRTRPVWHMEKGTVVPREQAFYVYYLCPRQRKLQEELEECVTHYKRKLEIIVESAIWHSKRNLVSLSYVKKCYCIWSLVRVCVSLTLITSFEPAFRKI